MAERRSEGKAKRRGWIATLALGMVGIASGFTVGIVAGVGWEEPSLVFDYITGDTEQVDWRSPEFAAVGEPEPPLPTVAAPPPADPQELRDAAAKGRAPVLKAKAVPVEKSSLPGGGYSIQVGAFSDSESAHRLVGSLREKGYRVYLSRVEEGDSVWRVRVGPLRTRAKAEVTALELERREKLDTWVMSEGS